MAKLSMCRICLAEDLRMQTVLNTHLEEMFRSLSLMPFATRDGRPMLACFFCCAKLQKCYELRKNILRSEQLFTQILRNDVIVPPELGGIFHKNRLRITQVVDISVGINEQKKKHVEIEVPETIFGSSVKLEIPEGIFGNIVGASKQMKEHVEIKVPNPETIDVSTVKLEVPEVFENDPLEGDEDNVSLDIVKKEKDDITIFENDSLEEDEDNVSLDIVKKEKDDITNDSDSDENNTDSSMQYISPNDPLDYLEFELDDGITRAPVHNKLRVASQRNLEDITKSIDTKFNKATDKIAQSKTDTEIVVRQKIRTKSHYVIPTKDKSTFSECIRTSEHNDIQMESPSINISVDTSVSNNARKNLNPQRCDICQKCFRDKGTLIRHIRTHTGEKPLKCKLCEKRFSQKAHLNSHIHTHTSEKPYKCKFCEKCFCSQTTLNRHIYTHASEKPFKCKFCENSFSQKVILNSHIRTHTGEKPFKCKLCEKRFSRKDCLNNHLRKHTGEKPYKCKFCEQSFSYKPSLSVHIRTHTAGLPQSLPAVLL